MTDPGFYRSWSWEDSLPGLQNEDQKTSSKDYQEPSVHWYATTIYYAHDAMSYTFERVFTQKKPKVRPQVTFLPSFESGDGIYWISGHPGFGKSTLIKFIYDHPTTRRSLENWAGYKCLVRTIYFLDSRECHTEVTGRSSFCCPREYPYWMFQVCSHYSTGLEWIDSMVLQGIGRRILCWESINPNSLSNFAFQ